MARFVFNVTEQMYDLNSFSNPHLMLNDCHNFMLQLAFRSVRMMRGGFDIFSGFIFGERNEKKWLK